MNLQKKRLRGRKSFRARMNDLMFKYFVSLNSTLGKILELNNFQNYVEINFEVSLYTH